MQISLKTYIGYIVAGHSYSNSGDVTGNHGSSDYWVVKLDDESAINKYIDPFSNLFITPNPVSQSTTISFSLSQSENLSVGIYDITGRLVTKLFDEKLNSGSHEIKWDVSGQDRIDDGIYFVNFIGDGFSYSSKMVVLK